MAYRYRCTCGRTGRWFANPNDADTYGDYHLYGSQEAQNSQPCATGTGYTVEEGKNSKTLDGGTETRKVVRVGEGEWEYRGFTIRKNQITKKYVGFVPVDGEFSPRHSLATTHCEYLKNVPAEIDAVIDHKHNALRQALADFENTYMGSN